MNEVYLLGNLGKDPDMGLMNSGMSICKLLVITNDKYKDKSGQMVESSELHKVHCYGALASLCNQYLKKGSKVLVRGSISSFKTDEGGYFVYVKAFKVMFLDSKKNNSQDGNSNVNNQQDDWY